MEAAASALKEYLQVPVSWTQSADPLRPLTAQVDGHTWVLRLNDFPAEPLFTLFVDEEEIGHVNDPPQNWLMPM